MPVVLLSSMLLFLLVARYLVLSLPLETLAKKQKGKRKSGDAIFSRYICVLLRGDEKETLKSNPEMFQFQASKCYSNPLASSVGQKLSCYVSRQQRNHPFLIILWEPLTLRYPTHHGDGLKIHVIYLSKIKELPFASFSRLSGKGWF